MNDCGCVDEGEVLMACRTHWIAMEFAFFHPTEDDGHMDCCDVPQMRQLINEYGDEDVRKAIGSISRQYLREYAGRVLTATEANA